jgi:hypothetical protein
MRAQPLGARLFLLLLPLAMFAWMFPFTHAMPTIGKDYPIFAPLAQVNLMWSVHKGTFPLYMPGFAGGTSTAAMTLGQLYHPISWLSSVMPGYGAGQSLEWTTLFRLLSLGLAHLSLFTLCRRLRLAPVLAFVVTLPAVYNLRMLDSFRYGPPVDAYAAMVLACSAAGFVYLALRRSVGGRRATAFLAFSTYLLAANGHPQWAFLGLLVTGIFALAFPWTAAALSPAIAPPTPRDLARYLGLLTLGFGSGVLLAAPYLLTFYFEFLALNVSRVAREYEWTVGYSDSVRGVLGNFVSPLHSDVHTAFGGSVLPLIAALLPGAALAKRPPRVLWVLYAVAAFSVLFALGTHTWVHAAVVEHVPFFGSFRAPGRITLWLPIVTFPIAAWMLRWADRGRLLGAAALVVCAGSALVRARLSAPEGVRTPHMIHLHDVGPWFEWLVFALFAATILFLFLSKARARPRTSTLAALAMLAGAWLCLFVGTWKTEKRTMQTFEQLEALRHASVRTNIVAGFGMETAAWEAYKAAKIPAPRARALCSLAHHAEGGRTDAEVLNALTHADTADEILLDRAAAPMSDASEPIDDVCELTYNTSNRHVFDVTTGRDAYVALGVPWLPGFTARVDGVPQEVARGDALFPTVFVPRGHHEVDLRFVSRPFLAGVALAFATLWCWAVAAARRRRAVVGVVGLLLGAAMAVGLEHALFHGPSFETRFRSPVAVVDAP